MAEECTDMRPECARDFGEIKQHLVSHGEKLDTLCAAMIGNGNIKGGLLSRVAKHGAYLKLLGVALVVLTPPAIYAIVKLIQSR